MRWNQLLLSSAKTIHLITLSFRVCMCVCGRGKYADANDNVKTKITDIHAVEGANSLLQTS